MKKEKGKNVRKKLNIILIFLFLIPMISAISINIDVKDSFQIGEKITFNYSISGESEEIFYSVNINCPKMPLPLLDLQTETPPIKGVFDGGIVNEVIEPQICNAFVSVSEPINLYKNKSFEIITNPSFEFNINICKDTQCYEKPKVFIQGENIYLVYSSDVSDLTILGILTYPDGKTEEINLPTSIKAEQIGTYNLEVNASKENYKTATVSEQFGVIESEADIIYSSVEDIKKESETKINLTSENIKKQTNENESKNEVAGKTEDKESESGNKKYTYFFIIISVLSVIIGIIGYILFLKLKQKKK